MPCLGKGHGNGEPTGIRQLRFGQVVNPDLAVELRIPIGLVDQKQVIRYSAPIHEGAIIRIGVIPDENEISRNGALRFGIAGDGTKKALMEIREGRRKVHPKPGGIGQEDPLFAVQTLAAAKAVLDIELSQIAAPNLALNRTNK